MKGIKLNKYTAEIQYYNGSNINSMLNESLKIMSSKQSIKKYIQKYGRENIEDFYINIPSEIYELECTFNEICKLYYSSYIMMDINKKFEKNFNYEIIRKLSNSMWRWEMSYKSITSWNTIVDAYNCIRSVKIDNFDITLDYTTSCNEKGYSKFSRTYLDGVFAFLIHYNGEHVMTIGFTVLSNHRILINQVQLVKKHGNRFLFKMGNRIEWSIDLFHTFFKNFNIYLIKGIDLSQSIYEQYKSQYDSNNYHLKKAKENLRLNPSNEYNNWAINHYSLQLKECKSKIDLFRERTYNHIIKVYGVNLNRYRRCSSIKKMQLRFNFIKEKK